MSETKIEELALSQYRKLSLLQEPLFEEFKESLNKIINAEVNKYSKKMKNTRVSCYHEMLKWKSDTKNLQQKLNEKQALIGNLQVDKESLQNRLEWCSNEIESQRRQILEQQNDLKEKSKRIQILENTNIENLSLIDKQKSTIEKIKAQNIDLQSKIPSNSGIPTQQRFITSQQSLGPPHFQSVSVRYPAPPDLSLASRV